MKTILFYLKQLNSFSGKILYFNLFGMSFISFLEGMGILLLIPMLSMSGIMGSGNTSGVIARMIDFFPSFPQKISFPAILITYVALVIIQNLLQRNLTIRNIKIISGFMYHIRLETYQALLFANWEFFLKKRKSDLINIFTSEFSRVSGGINQILQFISSLLFTLVQISLAFVLSPNITLFVLASGVILAIFSRKFIKRSNLLGKKSSKLLEEYLGGITDQLNGIKEIKSNTLEKSRISWLHTLTDKMLKEQVEYIELKTSSQLFYKIVSTVIIACFLYFSVQLFHSQPGQFLLIIVIFSKLWPRITSIQSSLEQIASLLPAFKAIINLNEECEKLTERGQYSSGDSGIPLVIENEIECQRVSFRYNRKEPVYALQEINLIIPANCMTAIVGRSGAGKSTLIDLLMGLNKPDNGDVFFDGKSINQVNLFLLRKAISYVPQDPFLFNGTIRENLMLVDPSAKEEQIWEALEFAAAAEFVRELPKNIDTIIGDRGVRLSGGERQRIVLARAILRKPSILVLDEATSALDTENESKIQEALEKLKGKMTIIVIAHRLSTIRNADQVIVLEQGEIIQQGKFYQLAAEKRGLFRQLLNKQLEVSV